jgi:hypothetical protein
MKFLIALFIGTISSTLAVRANCTHYNYLADTVVQSPAMALQSKILRESANGGTLDYWTPIKGHEYDGHLISPGLFATNREIAVIKWAMSVIKLGIKNEAEVIAIFEELKKRKANEGELTCIKLGIKKAGEN